MQHSYDWIISCIESSTNEFQFDCCHTLIKLFGDMYKKEWDKIKGQQKIEELEMALHNQRIKHNVEI